jgi:hypothetical protein
MAMAMPSQFNNALRNRPPKQSTDTIRYLTELLPEISHRTNCDNLSRSNPRQVTASAMSVLTRRVEVRLDVTIERFQRREAPIR